MKRAIVVTIAALMIACVLPMARAQEASSDSKRIVNDEIVRVSVQDRDRLSPEEARRLKDLQKRLDQMMDQQKNLADHLRALAERRHEALSHEGSPEQGHELSQDLKALQTHLDEMAIQQEILQEQLRTLAENRRGRQQEPAGRGRPRRERVEVREDIDVMASPGESPEREARESIDRIRRDQLRREEARTERERASAVDEAKRAEVEARRAQAQEQRQYAEKMRAWGEETRQWEQGEQMQQWRRRMEDWQKQMQEWAHSLVPGGKEDERESPDVAPEPPMPPMPPMPEMPKMPGDGKQKMKMKLKDADPTYGEEKRLYKEGLREDDDEDISEDVLAVRVPHIKPPVPPIPPEVPENAENQGEIVEESSFSSIPGDRILEVGNHVGSITVRSGDRSEYEVHAVTRVKADTEERIREIAEQLSITDTGPLPDGVERIIVSKPKGLKDRENVTVAIEVIAPRDAKLKLHQEVGDIRLHGLRGSIEASDRVGSIRAVDVTGRVALNTDVGGIDIIVPEGLSARIQAKTNLGGIQTDLPLEFAKPGGLALGSSGSGIVGRGDDNIALKTNVGSIKIRSQAPESERADGDRPPRPQPRPKPTPEPAPTGAF